MHSEAINTIRLPSVERKSDEIIASKLGLDHITDIEKESFSQALKLDPHGLPLVPQPSEWEDDPLNWPRWLKWTVLIQVCFMAFLGPFNTAVVNPSLELLADGLHQSVERASYSTAVSFIFGGVAGFAWAPLANQYGRRPVTLFAMLFSICGMIGAALSKTYTTLIISRAINGIGLGSMMTVGTACIADMFFLHECGEKTGVYTIFITNGAHLAAILGGYAGQTLGWRWDFYIPAIITASSLTVAIFLFPETLFSRDPEVLAHRTQRSYWKLLFDLKGNMIPGRKLKVENFTRAIFMLKYPSIALSAWFYLWCWTFLNFMPAITIAKIYTNVYHLEAGPIGVCGGVSLLAGTLIGEVAGGKLSDYILYRLAKKNNNVRVPEHRLYMTTISALLMPTGIMIFGWCVQKRYMFVIPLIGIAIGCLGLQTASTCIYSYVSDCYKAQTPESGVVLNFARGLCFVVGFFGLRTAEKIGYGWAWTTFALVLFIFWLPILWLMFNGQYWRHKLGTPYFNRSN